MGSSSQQLYSLSWGEFGSSLTSAVQSLRGQGDLVDVTLAAGGRTFAAHKIVLSAASPFLLDLLKSTPCDHPVVMLAGVGAEELESLLEFVYRGEVSVEPSQLPSLLQAAHCLSIHGLMPPTLLAQNSEEIPPSVAQNPSPLSRETIDLCVPRQQRKRRRKSATSSVSKWKRGDHVDNEDHSHDETSPYFDHTKDSEGLSHDDAASVKSPLESSTHRTTNNWLSSQSSPTLNPENFQQNHLQPHHNPDNMPDVKPNLQALQQFSPLQIPSFPGPLTPGLSAMLQNAIAASTSSATMIGGTPFKIRGASDCPGVCPLCGSTLRQARNLRRHLLSSCKYRLNNHNPNQSGNMETVSLEIKPDMEIPGYNTVDTTNYVTDSGGSDSCERIICRPSLLPPYSPHSSNDVSPRMSPLPGNIGRSLDPNDCQGPVSTCSV